ncbi:hypothetical protein ACSIGC_08835 [Tenacibaculum sp. ZS6-P6]|uniref:hypothetical protein n=1 Tax=Tenacibaculum sp. ZS6-P6 TaxID=3447503 RepID=UPI003F9C2A07
MKKSISTLGKILNKEELALINGQISREEFCAIKKSVLLGDYQGDLSYGYKSYYTHCGSYGYPLW